MCNIFYIPNFRPEKASGIGYLGQFNRRLLLLPESDRCRHTLVVGGPGAGKTTSYFLPNILLDAYFGHTAVVYDLKYPDQEQGLWASIGFYIQQQRPAYHYTPSESHSMRLPVLHGVNDLKEALLLAEIITTRPQVAPAAEYHLKAARAILAATLLRVIDQRGAQASLGEVYEVLSGSVEQVKRYLGMAGHSAAQQALERQTPSPTLRSVFDIRDDRFAGWLTGLVTDSLLLFTDPSVDRATSQGRTGQTIPLDTLFCQPSCLYLGIPQSFLEMESAQALLRMSKRVIDRSLLGVKDRYQGRLPVHTSIYIDELPSFSRIPRLLVNLATLRSARVALHLGIQNFAQLRTEYGSDESEALKTSNFFSKVYFPTAIDGEDARQISESLGQATYYQQTRGRSHHPQGASWSLSEQPIGQPLLSPEEFRSFPRGQALIQRLEGPPIRVSMPLLSQPQSRLHRLFCKVTPPEETPLSTITPPSPLKLPPLPPAEPMEPLPRTNLFTRGQQLASFRRFVMQLVWQGYPLTAHQQGQELLRCSLRRQGLDPAQQKRLDHFHTLGYLGPHPQQPGVYLLAGNGEVGLGPLLELAFSPDLATVRQWLQQWARNPRWGEVWPLSEGVLVQEAALSRPPPASFPRYGTRVYLPLLYPQLLEAEV